MKKSKKPQKAPPDPYFTSMTDVAKDLQVNRVSLDRWIKNGLDAKPNVPQLVGAVLFEPEVFRDEDGSYVITHVYTEWKLRAGITNFYTMRSVDTVQAEMRKQAAAHLVKILNREFN